MHRALVPALSLVVLLTTVSTVLADGLYVGHGRRSHDRNAHPWAARINLGGGAHGISDPFYTDDYYYDDFYGRHEFGGFGTIGLEIHAGNHVGLEVYGSYREVDDTDRFRSFFFGNPETVIDHYDSQVASAGLTLRNYFPVRGSSSYFGLGGGYVHSESLRWEAVDGVQTFRDELDSDGGEFHFLAGWEGRIAPSLSLGLEVGYRYTWLDNDEDFGGAMVGLRLGVLLGS